jgi:hypothetical protein
LLQTISQKCRFTGGIGVVWARALIGLNGIEDDPDCGLPQNRSSKNFGRPINSMEIYPNPSALESSCVVVLPFDSGFVLLRDLFGREIRRIKISDYKVEILLNNISGGLYIIEGHSVNQPIISKKLIIY